MDKVHKPITAHYNYCSLRVFYLYGCVCHVPYPPAPPPPPRVKNEQFPVFERNICCYN
jgi:hypothetical protein